MNAQTATRPQQFTAGQVPQLAPAANIVPLPEPRIVAPSYPPKLAKTIMAITREFGAIKKDGWNDFHKYHYQKWEDVLDRESKLFADHGIILQQSEIARSLLDKLISITYEFTIISEDGEVWPDRPVFTAIGRLQDHKGIFDDKAANKCHTQAHKYFLLHTFKVKTRESDDADAETDEVAPKQIDRPKPPRPGSAEAKAADEPAEINANSATEWANAFIAAIERAEDGVKIQNWIDINQERLGRLAKYPAELKRVNEAVGVRREQVRAVPAKPPKPPRPGAAAPAVKLMPDASTDPESFIAWLTEKMESFDTYEPGETYWNDTIQALDLPNEVQEDAMGVWRRFERRFES